MLSDAYCTVLASWPQGIVIKNKTLSLCPSESLNQVSETVLKTENHSKGMVVP
jgi:hypothetical protein